MVVEEPPKNLAIMIVGSGDSRKNRAAEKDLMSAIRRVREL